MVEELLIKGFNSIVDKLKTKQDKLKSFAIKERDNFNELKESYLKCATGADKAKKDLEELFNI